MHWTLAKVTEDKFEYLSKQGKWTSDLGNIWVLHTRQIARNFRDSFAYKTYVIKLEVTDMLESLSVSN